MRLLSTRDLKPHIFNDYATVPPYAILSHVWDDREQFFGEREENYSAYYKLNAYKECAARDGYQYIWMDTCCIDKRNSTELSEAINSMYKWYQQSQHCYVHLADVHADDRKQFEDSRWFTRAWTLLELLAPRALSFYSSTWEPIGSKQELLPTIVEITGIPASALTGAPMSSFTVEERLRWVEPRHVARSEDMSYCMLGVLEVYMPLIYGEGGESARRRLLREVESAHSYKVASTERTATTVTKEGGSAIQYPDEPVEQHVPSTSISRKTAQRTPHSELGARESNKLLVSEKNTYLPIHYTPLKPNGFRLLTIDAGTLGHIISGKLEEHDLRQPPAYYALSYVWGSEPTLHSTSINGQASLIQPNLYHALQRFRLSSGTFAIWVDTLCINQADAAERTLQVNAMGPIYRKASGVLIWLGEEDSTSKLALQFLPKTISSHFRWSEQWWEEPGFAAVMQLTDRPWFRRGWVIQEAAFSLNSIIRCGDREIHFDLFITAMKTIGNRLDSITLTSSQVLAHFNNSAAMKLIDIVTSCLRARADKSIRRTMSLEMLVSRTIHCDTSDPRDAIYTLLSLANDASDADGTSYISPDYWQPVLDTFVSFIMHCCERSGQVDIICRPWAPTSMIPLFGTNAHTATLPRLKLIPSWLATKEMLPYGQPSERLKHRANADALVTRGKARCYYAHYGTRPSVAFGRDSDGHCDGTLSVKGLILGQIIQRSSRMAHSVITRNCLDMLHSDPHSDTVWRTLCADRDDNGERAPHTYKEAMQYILRLSSEAEGNSIEHLAGIDPEELLASDLPEEVETFVKVVQSILWNRRTVRVRCQDKAETEVVGLSPQHSRKGDLVCILYGCSVPVVLRDKGEDIWQLVGEAYVHGMMDGEAVSSGGAARFPEREFVIK